MPDPITPERLDEIRDLNVDSCSADATYNPDVWALEFARIDLLDEVNRLRERAEAAERARDAALATIDRVARVQVVSHSCGGNVVRFVFASHLHQALGLPDGKAVG